MMDIKKRYLDSMASLEKMIDAELIEVGENDSGDPYLIMMRSVYDAFFFSDNVMLNDDLNRWQRFKIWVMAMLRRRKWFETNTKYFHTTHWFDEDKALSFLDKVRFMMNFRRGYVAGLRNYGREENVKSEEDFIRKLWIPQEQWISFYVLSDDLRPLILGRWKHDKFELKKYEESNKDIRVQQD